MNTLRTYTELEMLETLEDRFAYLQIGGQVGESTFGFDRWVNQQFYKSKEWRSIRNHIKVRDLGYDLGDPDTKITGDVYVHHMNPLMMHDFECTTDQLLDPEFLISASLRTHNAVHYGDASLLPQPYIPRRPGDTLPY